MWVGGPRGLAVAAASGVLAGDPLTVAVFSGGSWGSLSAPASPVV